MPKVIKKRKYYKCAVYSFFPGKCNSVNSGISGNDWSVSKMGSMVKSKNVMSRVNESVIDWQANS